MAQRSILRIRDLSVRFFTARGQVNAVESVSFDVREGERLGFVGESGAGKSVLMQSVIGLLESPGQITNGEIWYHEPTVAEELQNSRPEVVDGEYVDLARLSEGYRRSLRGTTFSMVFQDAMSSMNPSVTVGEQVAEAVESQKRARANPRTTQSRTQGFGFWNLVSSTIFPSRRYVTSESRERAIELLSQVGIPDPEERAEQYPHEFSGGMLQRAMIAQALASDPDILIADEPTTALDVTIQAQILKLLSDIQEETSMSIIMVTHNLGVASQICDTVNVMYAGEIVEQGTPNNIFENPVHPYTEGLIGSVPDLNNPKRRLDPIKGTVPALIDSEMGDKCYFVDRCPKAMEKCLQKPDEYTVGGDGGEGDGVHRVLCYLAEEEYDPASRLRSSPTTEETP